MTDNRTDHDLIEPTDEWMQKHGFVPVNWVKGCRPTDGGRYYWEKKSQRTPYRVGDGFAQERTLCDLGGFLLQVAAFWREVNEQAWMLSIRAAPRAQEDPEILYPQRWNGEQWEGYVDTSGETTYFLPMIKSFLRERGWM